MLNFYLHWNYYASNKTGLWILLTTVCRVIIRPLTIFLVNILNSKVPPVSRKTLVYSYNDNGKKIVSDDRILAIFMKKDSLNAL